MVQAKGILPRGEDRDILFKSPRTCGYFVAVTLHPLDRAGLKVWLDQASDLVDALVERELPKTGQDKGDKVAAVAVGFSPSFFAATAGFDPPIDPPGAFNDPVPSPQDVEPLASAPLIPADVMFYVASVYEARVNAFVHGLQQTGALQTVRIERGYQRLDGTEPFGYRDGVRNAVPGTHRPEVIYVHQDDTEADEPDWVDGGSYMAYLKIRQHPEAFAALDSTSQDAVIGRRKDGKRLDMVDSHVEPGHEPADVPDGLPQTAHVRRAGPRGANDDTQIFRRGLPYIETTPEGELRSGLQFCSFQASLDQFEVVFNDWCLNPHFPPTPDGSDPGLDALLDPGRGLTSIESFGFFFVPPYQEAGLAASILPEPSSGKHTTGRLVVHKRVRDQADPKRRFERRGFVFQILDDEGSPVGAEFATNGSGRAKFDGELALSKTFHLHEVHSPIPNIALIDIPFTMQKTHQRLRVENLVTVPATPYGANS